jgi:membrane protein implicated in regulation of membrane protease activity
MSITLIWLIAGVCLCIAELILPTAFVIFMMGIVAIFVAIVSLVLPFPNLLIALWLIFSVLGILLSRRFFTPKRQLKNLGDDCEGEALTAILPGKTGRVLYEGNSWRAKCADNNLEIAKNEAVYIVEKQGNTLIVLPLKFLSQA